MKNDITNYRNALRGNELSPNTNTDLSFDNLFGTYKKAIRKDMGVPNEIKEKISEIIES